jgi:hypothetical protein
VNTNDPVSQKKRSGVFVLGSPNEILKKCFDNSFWQDKLNFGLTSSMIMSSLGGMNYGTYCEV